MDTTAARKRLEDIRDELTRSITVLQGEHADDVIDQSFPRDPADAGSNLSEADRAAAVISAARAQRSHVLEALHRIDEGTYGTCVDCAAPVPEGRLEARPDAERCVSCQSRRDRKRH